MIKKLFKCIVKSVFNFSIVFLVIVLTPGLPPQTTFPFEPISIVKPKTPSGALELNNHLDNGERLFEGKLLGPESLIARGKTIYSSLGTGEVVKIDGEHITHFVKFGKPCTGIEQEHICGRPLGLAFDTIGDNLIVADTYYGIYEVNLKTAATNQLISMDNEVDGPVPRKPRLINTVAVAKNGDIYWTDSSSDFSLHDGVFTFMANPSGRLIHYSRSQRKNTVLLDKIWFSNGLALPSHEEFIIVSETQASRLQKCYLKGAKKGECEMFIEGLPGMPDNLTPDEDGIWVPLVASADPENPNLAQSVDRLPHVRKFLIRLLMLLEAPFKLIQNFYPNPYTERIVYKIGHFKGTTALLPDRTTIVRVDWNGNVVGALHGFDQSVHSISEVLEFGDYLYLGSPYNDFIGRVKFVNRDKVHPVKAKTQKVVETPPPTKAPVTTQKPTTTTTTTRPPTTTTTTTRPPTTTTTTTRPPPTTTKPPPTTTKPPPTTTKKPETRPPTTQKPVTQPPTTQKPVTQPPTTQKPVTQPPTTKKPETKPPPTKKPETQPPNTAEAEKPTTKPPYTPRYPAPIHETVDDIPPPPKEPVKIIKKDKSHGEL